MPNRHSVTSQKESLEKTNFGQPASSAKTAVGIFATICGNWTSRKTEGMKTIQSLKLQNRRICLLPLTTTV